MNLEWMLETKTHELNPDGKYLGIITGFDRDTITFEVVNLCFGTTTSVPSHQRRKLSQICATSWNGQPYQWEDLGLDGLLKIAHMAINRMVFLEFGFDADGKQFDLQNINGKA